MFTIFKTLTEEYNRGLDEAKLVEFKKHFRNITADKLENFCIEIHYIMQRHYCDEKMLDDAKKVLNEIDEYKKHKKEVQHVKTHNAVSNYYIHKKFMTKWS